MTSKKQTTERLRYNTSYGLYCLNFYGSGLKAIKNEFILQIRTGLRQPLFVLDLEEILEEIGKPSRNSKIKNEFKESFNLQLINKIMQAIQGFCKEYENVTNKLNKELKFDLNQYLQNEVTKKLTLDKASIPKEKPKTKESQPSKGSNGTKELSCTSSLIAREHNRVGNPPLLRKKKYIKDEPTLGKLYIIILGQMNKNFYTDLLRHHLPLEGILNFIPSESKYDIMLGNNKLQTFIENTLENLKSLFDDIRQEKSTKSVGLLTLELPVISYCLALKNSREIFDQLTWSIYDVDILKKQYEKFYFKPFQVIDVDIPVSENLRELYYVAESMSMRSQFQKSKFPKSGTDLATIVSYLDGLLNTCGGLAVVLVANLKHSPFLNTDSRNSFSSITKIHKYERLVLDANNKVLLNMLQYIDPEKFWSIYLSCLEYNMLRQYIIPPLKGSTSISIKQKTGDFPNFTLPKYVKYYTNEDCCYQRTEDLLNEYNDYEILNISPGYRLYIFKRNYNVLIEREDKMVIPTRLCFRDFTLYKMEEFLDNLKTSKSKTTSSTASENNAKPMEFNENVLFIRPNSIKAHNLEKEGACTENKARKSDSKTKISKKEKKSSLTKSIFESEEGLGLPSDHQLLKGYNLEDTLQEVKCKTSKYYYHHGFVKLYEEKWCFQEMNKLLTLFINNATIFFSAPRLELKGISNNIRLLTKNDISIRILNDPKECSKIVMNYPNGLSVFYNEKSCEQVWFSEETPRDEQRRIYTLCGAVIVFFKSGDMIMIARYNGEVYRLYQHVLGEEEEEQSFATDLGDVQEKSSGFRDLKAQGDTNKNFPNYNFLVRQREKTRKLSKLSTMDNQPSRNSERLLSKESVKSNSTTHNLQNAIKCELYFLNLLCSIYDLKYLHCIITTSQGKRINLTHQGEVSDGPNCSIHEWHDYFANESYCERSDGVKMIWTQDSFKCFHKDGSAFTTTIGEDLENPIKDEFELQISQSSSHNEIKKEIGDNKLSMDIKDSDKNVIPKSFNCWKMSLSENPSIFTDNENKEEYSISLDIPFASFNCHSWVMQHSNYAGVKILSSTTANLSFHMEIFGIDGIRIYNHVKEYVGNNISEYDSIISEFEECVEDKTNIKTVVHIWIGENLHVTADEEKCDLFAIMPKYEVEKVAESDSLTLSLKYKDCLSDAFKYLVNEIASFEGFPGKNIQELYFMEKENKDSTRRGFEFCTSLPLNSNCKHQLSNIIIELKPLNTIQESIFCNCECFKEDLNKFPRFKKYKFCYKAKQDFPRVLSANIFLKIPVQLRSLTDITKFLEPFENITFKKLRGKFKNVLNYHLKLEQKFQLNVSTSSKSWKKRHEEHERRVFNEQKRLGLYYAMNKHKIYPDYWKFIQNNGGKVKNIEFFDFIENNCGKKGRV